MNLYPHLCFDGQCEEAFLEYQRVLGGTVKTMMKYGESPMAKEFAPRWHNRIIHALLQTSEFELAGADLLPEDYKKPQGFFVILNIPEKIAAKNIFDSLSVGGTVQFPFEETFWSAGFGALVDRFGIPWEVNCEESPSLI